MKTKIGINRYVVGVITLLTLFSFLPAEEVKQNKLKEFSLVSNKIIKNSYIVTFKDPEVGSEPFIVKPNKENRGTYSKAFGTHSTWQSKDSIKDDLKLKGKIISIYGSNNAIHVEMSSKEAYRLSKDKRINSISPDRTSTLHSNTNSWGLDRLDSPTPTLNGQYNFTNTGEGQIIYVLDTGLDLSNAKVAAEFEGRASVLWDVNGKEGKDLLGHGTAVSSIIAGKTYGVAKNATLIMAKIINNPDKDNPGGPAYIKDSTIIFALDWLTSNAQAGSIINLSLGKQLEDCSSSRMNSDVDNAIKRAHDSGLIVVVSAGNDSCNTANAAYSGIPESFVVGSTSRNGIHLGQDRISDFSRKGWNISAFAPGEDVPTMNHKGNRITPDGTSFSAPYISGVFAVACQAAGTLCTSGDTAYLYETLRNTGTLGTVTNTNGSTLTGATPRFISQQW